MQTKAIFSRNLLKRPHRVANFLRIIILERYGGIWVDGDNIYLRDMWPFWNMNFAYRWSSFKGINNGVLGINKKFTGSSIDKVFQYNYSKINNSTNSQQFIDGFDSQKITNAILSLNNGSIFNLKPLKVFHSYLFDPVWCCHGFVSRMNKDSCCYFRDFMEVEFINREEKENFQPSNFFKGAFTYHLHTRGV